MKNKYIKWLVAFSFCMVLTVSVFSSNALAFCGKNDHTFQYDECTKCGYMRIHECKDSGLPSLLFIARQNDGDAPRTHKQPHGSSATVSWPKEGERLFVIGRTRNKYGNLWLKVAGNSYIWAEYTAFDFDATVDAACKDVHWLLNPIEWYGYMLVAFRSGGEYDLKNINLLGIESYTYYVYSNDIIQDNRMTGHDLGNILYGCVCARYGKTFEQAIHYAAWADYTLWPSDKKEEWKACWEQLQFERCDKENDRQLVYLGYWIEEHRSSNSCVPWKYDVASPY